MTENNKTKDNNFGSLQLMKQPAMCHLFIQSNNKIVIVYETAMWIHPAK
jgi:hypothetical protein